MIVRGVVVRGRSLGHKLGFPTANIVVDQTLSADNGVYRAVVTLKDLQYRGVANLGVKPTVGGSARGLEVYILEFEGDIYGETIEVELLEKIRDERHFNTLEELRCQVLQDIKIVKEII